MANPFLFDASVPAGKQDNPFLVDSAAASPPVNPTGMIPNAATVANPFLMSAEPQIQTFPQQASPFHQPQPQAGYNAFGQPMPMSMATPTPPVQVQQAANPFADFGTPTPAPIPIPAAAAAPVPAPTPVPVAAPNVASDPPTDTGLASEPATDLVPAPAPTQSSLAQSELFGDVEPPPPPPPAQSELFEDIEQPPPPPPLEEIAMPTPQEEETAIESQDITFQETDPSTVNHPAVETQEENIVKPALVQDEIPVPASEQIEKSQSADDREASLPPPPDVENFVGMPSQMDKISPEEEKIPSPSQEAQEQDVNDSSPVVEEKGPSTGANLFGLDKEPELEEKQEEPEVEEEKPKMSTGDAIFADLPATDVTSTGASIFGLSEESAAGTTGASIFGVTAPRAAQPTLGSMSGWDDNFDRKFDSVAEGESQPLPVMPGDPFDPFAGSGMGTVAGIGSGFDDNAFNPAAPNSTPSIPRRTNEVPSSFGNATDISNPFLDGGQASFGVPKEGNGEETDSPLFDDDTSKPLEPFPRLVCDVPGWDMYIRHPPKKKLTAQRFWKKIFVRLVMQGDTPCVQLFENKDAKDHFQELPLQPAYSLSEISHQVFDQYSKIFTLKLQYIFYKERAGIRPGQISKMQKLTDKIGFLAKAVEDADYEGVKEFASDMKKLGVPLEHAPQISELLKLGSDNFEDMKQFSVCIEEKLFKMDVHRDRALTYKTEEVQLTAVDEVFVEQDKTGHVIKQICRVRVFFLSFLTGMPEVELGVNDIVRMGLEVVGRHDILPVPTEQWIRYEDIEFHRIVDKKEFEKNDHIIKFQPPDACYLEIMRFRVRPPKARELPMQARCQFIISGNRVEIKADMMIPYPHTKAWGQVPCEDVAMRIPLPECWIYQFRTEKHHVSLSQLAVGNLNIGTRMGSVKSAHRRAGKVKGIERFMGALESQTQELMETSSGQAKYEHQHKAIVWRVPRLPKHGQGSYTNHEFVCKLTLTSFDQMPESFEKHFYVEFTQPATAISNTVLRSVSIQNGSGEPPEKFVKYLARHEYKLEIDFAEKEQNTYMAVTKKVVEDKPQEEEEVKEYPDFPEQRKDSDSDSD